MVYAENSLVTWNELFNGMLKRPLYESRDDQVVVNMLFN